MSEEKAAPLFRSWIDGPPLRRRVRRGFRIALGLIFVVAVAVVAASLRHTPASSPIGGSEQARSATNPVRLENLRPGTTSWELPPAPAGSIEGYVSSASVLPGTKLDLHVSTRPEARYRVDLYRLGWYGGSGARRVDCGPSCSGAHQGTAQAQGQTAPAGDLWAGWPVTDELRIEASAVSGYYIAKLVLVTGPDRGRAATVPFVVRSPPGHSSAILVQAAVNTWQAYNSWGGKSLYDFNSSEGKAATRVSFDRPSVDQVLNQPLTWEYPLVRFLEREGYDIAYVTDVDTHRDPSELRRHRLVMTAGHDEYWTKEIRDGFDAALAAGTNMMFMGANTANWQIRYEEGERTIVEHRSASLDPETDLSRKTVRFRELPAPRPECQLMGVQSRGGLTAPGDPPRAYRPTAEAVADPWFAGTGLSTSSVLEDLIGYEWDVIVPGCASSDLKVLLHYEGAPSNADAIRYTAPSGATVFSSGTLQFSWGLDDWGHPDHAIPGLQRFMRNALDDLTS